MNDQDYIVRDKAICGGEPVLRGTHVTLRTILATLSDGEDNETILREFPTLTPDALRAVIAFAEISAARA